MKKIFSVFLLILHFCTTVALGKEPTNEDTGISQKNSINTARSDSIATLQTVYAKEFIFHGNTAIPTEELKRIASSYENREISIENLEQLRQELTNYYVNKGFLNSGVLIPDQKVDGGFITLEVIEGSLNEINIKGLRYFHEDYIVKRLENCAKRPVNINKLQEALLLLQEDSRIKKINADFKKGTTLGEGVLNVAIEETSPYLVSAFFDNDTSPSTGEYRGGISLAHQNLLGFGDMLAFNMEHTEGENVYSGSYFLPLSVYDTILELNYITGESRVTETLFKDLQIESVSDTYSLRVRQPLYKKPGKEFAIAITGEIRRSETMLLNRPFSFSPGAVNGESRESVLRFSQEWLDRGQSCVIAAHSTLSFGMDAFNATVHDKLPDGKFFTWLGQVLLAQRLPWYDSQIIFRTDLQLTDDNLLSMEQFSLGGLNSVRGYRKDLFLRDNGFASSIEFRIPVMTNEHNLGNIQIIPFADFGWARNKHPRSPEEECIYSVGLGLKWEIIKNFQLDAFYGHGLKEIEHDDNYLQDQGIYFKLTWQIL